MFCGLKMGDQQDGRENVPACSVQGLVVKGTCISCEAGGGGEAIQ
jgi:hypothetical protein